MRDEETAKPFQQQALWAAGRYIYFLGQNNNIKPPWDGCDTQALTSSAQHPKSHQLLFSSWSVLASAVCAPLGAFWAFLQVLFCTGTPLKVPHDCLSPGPAETRRGKSPSELKNTGDKRTVEWVDVFRERIYSLNK